MRRNFTDPFADQNDVIKLHSIFVQALHLTQLGRREGHHSPPCLCTSTVFEGMPIRDRTTYCGTSSYRGLPAYRAVTDSKLRSHISIHPSLDTSKVVAISPLQGLHSKGNPHPCPHTGLAWAHQIPPNLTSS